MLFKPSLSNVQSKALFKIKALMNSEFVEKMQLGDNFISGIDISDSGILIQPKEKKDEAVKIISDFLDDDIFQGKVEF